SGHTVTALYEIVPAGTGTGSGTIDPLKYQKPVTSLNTARGELATVKMRYKEPAGLKSKLFDVVVRNSDRSFASASEDLRFSASVAAFGMLLRESEFRGDIDYRRVIEMATASSGRDPDGYRSEFLRMVSAAKGMNSDTR
ncbi:MAG: DUF3520 domain-containing protein, partial [Bacteroidetes bacterium]|nr:DUF3520 domain-containing protein [Bacteroidota bacterium]